MRKKKKELKHGLKSSDDILTFRDKVKKAARNGETYNSTRGFWNYKEAKK